MVAMNEEIPDFETKAFHGNAIVDIKLSDFRGKWLVMAFYPADFTFVCPTELQELAQTYDQFQESDAEVVAISTDTAFSHLAWHDSSPAVGLVQFPMLADPTGKICKAFGTYIEDKGLSWRATFIIDPDGKLKAMSMHDNDIGRSALEILRQVQAAKHVRENPGIQCPAGWRPGAETVRPADDLVGKM